MRLSKDTSTFDYWNGSGYLCSVSGNGNVHNTTMDHGIAISMQSWTYETNLVMDCNVMMDPVDEIAYLIGVNGVKYDMEKERVELSTLRAAKASDRHWALTWDSLRMIGDTLRVIHGPRWKLVVYEPSLHLESIRSLVAEREWVDRWVRRAAAKARCESEYVIGLIKSFLLDMCVRDALAEMPENIGLPDHFD